MNWEIFSTIGYVSIALWLCMPLAWLVHFSIRQWGYLVHVSLLFGVVAYFLAGLNSTQHIELIRVDRSEQIEEQMNRQALAQQAAKAAREEEVPQRRFAEDNPNDFLDVAGMDDADLKYHEGIYGDLVPEWKAEKKERTADASDGSLESQIGAKDEQKGIDSAEQFEAETVEYILMSDADKTAAFKLQSLNYSMIRIMLGLGLLVVVFDYVSRANNYWRSYLPLPLPSRWADAFRRREVVHLRPANPRRSLLAEMKTLTRRGEFFVYVTDYQQAATEATRTLSKWPLGIGPVNVVNVAEVDQEVEDEFIFETLWFGRSSFVVPSAKRGQQMLNTFMHLLAERHVRRAHTRQRVHVLWDVSQPLSEEICEHFEELGGAAGLSLWLCQGAAAKTNLPDDAQPTSNAELDDENRDLVEAEVATNNN